MVVLAANVATVAPATDDVRVPLVVDLDETVVRTDLLVEQWLVLLRQRPLAALSLLRQLRQGRAHFKRCLARIVSLQPGRLPYRSDVLAYLADQKRRGRRLILATGADAIVAEGVARELDLFDHVLASDGVHNLTGDSKRARLLSEFGEKGFDYLGDGRNEEGIWRSARSTLLAGPTPAVLRRAMRVTSVGRTFEVRRHAFESFVRALRLHHWSKNSLILLPLVLLHRQVVPSQIADLAIALVAFCLCASSIYLLNDLLDLPFDRAHPQKCARALASGEIPLTQALALAPILALIGLALAVMISVALLAIIGTYLVLMTLYSLRLKHEPLLDVLTLAAGYAARVVAGYVVLAVTPSPWLVASCVLFFSSIALVKRHTELMLAPSDSAHDLRGRGYLPGDCTLLASQGVASGYLAVAFLAIFFNAAPSDHPTAAVAVSWVVCLLLFYWISYMWLMTLRGRMHHDPVVFALTDRVSQAVIVLVVIAGAYLW